MTESLLEQVCAIIPALEVSLWPGNTELLAPSLTPFLLPSLPPSLPQCLDLSACFSLTDSALPLALSHCPSLKILKLENCRKLTDAAFDHIVKVRKEWKEGGREGGKEGGLDRPDECTAPSMHPSPPSCVIFSFLGSLTGSCKPCTWAATST